jgi:hypothetical protein
VALNSTIYHGHPKSHPHINQGLKFIILFRADE